MRMAEIQKEASWRDWIENIGSSLICQISRHFHAVYLTWGAISELTTLEGYGILATRTRHPMLAGLLRRLAKDERRHFSFYYNMAREHLMPRAAQRLTTGVIKYFWLPVGGGYVPFAKTKAERLTSGDPRPSLEERYGNQEGYVAAVRAAAEKGVRARFLLREDADRIIQQAIASNVLPQ